MRMRILCLGVCCALLTLGTLAVLPGSAQEPRGESSYEGPPPHPGEGHRRGKAMRRMGMLKGKERFLRFSKEYYDAVKDPHAAIGFAALGIKEKYRKAGKPLEAIPELEKTLAATKDQGARNILLFTIRQIYEHERDAESFSRVNDQILKENLSAVTK